MYCSNCGNSIPDGVKFCPECGFATGRGGQSSSTVSDATVKLMYNKKSEGLALILSLIIPGLGHIYVGKVSTGVIILIAALIAGILGVATIVLLVAYVVIWIYGMYDSYKVAREYNQYLLEHDGNPPW